MAYRTCSVEGCERRHDSHGYCGMHYWRVKLFGEPGPVEPKRMRRGPECSVAECSAPVNGKGLCGKHYGRWRSYGDPLAGRAFTISQFTPEEWFARHRRVHESGCVHWTSSIDINTGYAYANFGQGQVLVHRWAYEHFIGPIPDGYTIDHTCHNADMSCPGGGPECLHRRCTNLDHFEAVSGGENARRGLTGRKKRKNRVP